jgi:excisionase family DNA binding protein
MGQPMPRVLLNSSTAAQRYGINKKTLQRWVHDEALAFPRPIVIGNKWYFKLAALEAWEDSVQSTEPPPPEN